MSKELDALEYLKENKRKHWLEDDKSNECLDTIEKALKDFEYLKSLFSIEWFDNLPTDDKIRVMKIMGLEIEYE